MLGLLPYSIETCFRASTVSGLPTILLVHWSEPNYLVVLQHQLEGTSFSVVMASVAVEKLKPDYSKSILQ